MLGGLDDIDVDVTVVIDFVLDGRVGDETSGEGGGGIGVGTEVGRGKEFVTAFEAAVDDYFEVYESDIGAGGGRTKNTQLFHGLTLLLKYYGSIIAQTV